MSNSTFDGSSSKTTLGKNQGSRRMIAKVEIDAEVTSTYHFTRQLVLDILSMGEWAVQEFGSGKAALEEFGDVDTMETEYEEWVASWVEEKVDAAYDDDWMECDGVETQEPSDCPEVSYVGTSIQDVVGLDKATPYEVQTADRIEGPDPAPQRNQQGIS